MSKHAVTSGSRPSGVPGFTSGVVGDPGPRSRKGVLRGIALVVGASGLLMPAAGADNTAETLRQLQAKREAVRADKARSAVTLDLLRARDADVNGAMRSLQNDVAGQQDLLLEAQRAVSEAEVQQKAAVARAAAVRSELDKLSTGITDRAVKAYVEMPDAHIGSDLGQATAGDMANRRTLVGVVNGEQLDALQKIRVFRADLEAQETAARDARLRADRRRSEVSKRLHELQVAQDRQLAFQEQVAERIAAASAEAEALSSRDAKLAAEISGQQKLLTEQLHRAQEDRKRREFALYAAKLNVPKPQPRAPEPSSSGSGGGASAPAAAPPTGGGGSSAGPAIEGGGSIVSVGGIQVHRSIAGQLQGLLGAARAAGFNLSGGGFRSPAGQIKVRRSNCGSSSYAIYQMPASSCRPPTAKPGASMHEQGKAIDFDCNGSLIRSRGSACFQWMKAHAGGYGFKNLPSEPWHWSTNGR